jgi:8-oxo-dGTP pyrophosphatase MutT (NUDIX family)
VLLVRATRVRSPTFARGKRWAGATFHDARTPARDHASCPEVNLAEDVPKRKLKVAMRPRRRPSSEHSRREAFRFTQTLPCAYSASFRTVRNSDVDRLLRCSRVPKHKVCGNATPRPVARWGLSRPLMSDDTPASVSELGWQTVTGFEPCRCAQRLPADRSALGARVRAGVLALSPDERFILAVTSRHQTSDGANQRQAGQQPARYILPAGGVEVGETPAAAACREAFEEAGARVQLLRPLVRHCSLCEAVPCTDSLDGKGTLRRPAVTFWFLGRVLELVPAEGGQWPESTLRQRCYLPLDTASAHNDSAAERSSIDKLRATLCWRADTRAAVEAFLRLFEAQQELHCKLDPALLDRPAP